MAQHEIKLHIVRFHTHEIPLSTEGKKGQLLGCKFPHDAFHCFLKCLIGNYYKQALGNVENENVQVDNITKNQGYLNFDVIYYSYLLLKLSCVEHEQNNLLITIITYTNRNIHETLKGRL